MKLMINLLTLRTDGVIICSKINFKVNKIFGFKVIIIIYNNNITINTMPKKYNFKSEIEKEQHFKEYFKDYYQENKENIKKNLYELKRCECCNMDVRKYKFQRHCTSKRHQKNAGAVDIASIEKL